MTGRERHTADAAFDVTGDTGGRVVSGAVAPRAPVEASPPPRLGADPSTRDDEPRRLDVEGWVVDLACLRRYPGPELVERAREHTTACATMGHCIESGYGVVDEAGSLHLLDDHATPLVLRALWESGKERGVRVRAQRVEEDGEMRTREVHLS